MKTQTINQLFKTLFCVLCSFLLLEVADAKPDKGKGNGGDKGGKVDKPGKPEKPSKPDKPDKPSKPDIQDKKQDHDFDKKDDVDYKSEPWRAHRFEDNDRNILLDYFRGFESEPNGLPPGLQKKLDRGKPLPPGWQKKVSEGSILDATLNDLLEPLEDALFPNLRRQPDTRLYLYGDRVIRVYEPRRQVIDIFPIPSIKLW